MGTKFYLYVFSNESQKVSSVKLRKYIQHAPLNGIKNTGVTGKTLLQQNGHYLKLTKKNFQSSRVYSTFASRFKN